MHILPALLKHLAFITTSNTVVPGSRYSSVTGVFLNKSFSSSSDSMASFSAEPLNNASVHLSADNKPASVKHKNGFKNVSVCVRGCAHASHVRMLPNQT